jgi:hypothetical protein
MLTCVNLPEIFESALGFDHNSGRDPQCVCSFEELYEAKEICEGLELKQESISGRIASLALCVVAIRKF